jgi:hypothetical protein
MQETLMKEKPDLLFNNPLKQKAYVFLKNNPGKSFEIYQVLTNDVTVSRQLFNEVEQAIKAREERERPRETPKDLTQLFLTGNPFEKPKLPSLSNLFNSSSPSDSGQSAKKESPLNKSEKKRMNERAKQYIRANSDCTYDELVQNLNFRELTKPHFFAMKTQLRKKGLISGESTVRRGRKPNSGSQAPRPVRVIPTAILSTSKTIEIVESVDASGFSPELKAHYKSHVLPLLKRLLPNAGQLQMVTLSDPAVIEFRRGI